MRSFSIIALLSCLALVYAGELPEQYAGYKHIRDTPGEGYKLYTQLADSVTLCNADKKDTFEGLDAFDDDKKVTEKELKDVLYWYDELAFARKKILKTLDKSKDNTLTEQEVTDVLDDREYELALVECHYIKAETLREFCLADQLLTYIALVIDEEAINKFFDEVDTSDNNKITKEEVQTLPKLTDVDNFLEELGGHDGDISPKEFKDYLIQESISDDLRRCRRQVNPETGAGTYDIACLKEELVEYSQDDLTELDIALLFRYVDIDGKNGITAEEIKKVPGVSEKVAKHIFDLIDRSVTKDKKIDYAEFRTYLKSPTVQLQLERLCTETKKTQKEELDCLQEEFVKIANGLHEPIWLIVPDLDQLSTFEKIETSDDGIIEPNDIEWGQAETNFFSELDHDKSGYVCLEEFNEYADIPHMVYGMGDGMLTKKGAERANCYEGEVKKVMENILPKDVIGKWFDKYDTDNNGVINVEDKNEASDVFDNEKKEKYFLEELGQGDETVSLFEFSWFVKQEELASTYKGETHPDKLHEKLETYLNDDMTEFDIQELFKKLDSNGDQELDESDFPECKEWKKTLDQIDNKGEKDRDDKANFNEFWLWINSTHKGKTIEHFFEEECTKKKDTQKDEIDCYIQLIKSGHFAEK